MIKYLLYHRNKTSLIYFKLTLLKCQAVIWVVNSTTGFIILLYVYLVTSIMGPWPGLRFTTGKKSKTNNNQSVQPY